MNVLLPEWPLLAAFLTASFILAVTPGPGVLYIVARSISQGRRAGLASVAGVALGNLLNAVAATFGLAALFAVSSTAFLIVKYAGAAYLIYLGVRALRAPKTLSVGETERDPTAHSKVFRDGLLVALLNPKTTIFYAAFLPQFMSPELSPALQGIALGALFVTIAALTDSVYALGAGALAPLLSRADSVRTTGRYLSAAVYFGLGLFTALSGGRNGSVLPRA